MAQGRAALSPLSALGGFVFPPVPLKGAIMGISIRTTLTCPSHIGNFTSFSSSRPEMCPAREGKLKNAGSVVVLHFSARQICQRLGMPAMCCATCSSFKRLCPLNVPPAEHHLEVKLRGWLSSGGPGQEEVSHSFMAGNARPSPLPRPDFPKEAKVWCLRAEKQNCLCHGNQMKNNYFLLFSHVALKDSILSNHPAACKFKWWREEQEGDVWRILGIVKERVWVEGLKEA